MTARFAHRAKILALDITITAMKHTQSSDFLRHSINGIYKLLNRRNLFIWISTLIAFGIGGYLIGYLLYYLIP